MGVTGLLQHLKEIQEPKKLDDYRGRSLAVDTYGWLHRGLISCAAELCQDLPTRKYVNSVIKKVEMLRHFGVEPFLVFDGAHLPTKAETAKERRLKREEAKAKAEEYTRKGNRKLAWKEYMKAAGVTPEMAKSIMVELDRLGVRYVVAPYEADPQMVYLEKIGVVDGILSEDSDLLVFGCNRLITKLNDYGDCIEICQQNFGKVKKLPELASFTPEQLRLVAMLSGCDYTKGIPSIGIKTAFSLVRRFSSLSQVLNVLRTDGKSIPANFEEEVKLANLAFQYQKVFNPTTQSLETLNALPDPFPYDFDVLELCCGETLDALTHQEICNGIKHPNTHDMLLPREQSLSQLKSTSLRITLHTSLPTQGSMLRSKSVSITQEKTSLKGIDSFFAPVSKRKPSTTFGNANKQICNRIQEKKPSPTTRKIVNVLEEINSHGADVSPSKRVSKFFSTKPMTMGEKILPPAPAAVAAAGAADSSMFSGDSDISEDPYTVGGINNDILTNKLEMQDSPVDTDDDTNDAKNSGSGPKTGGGMASECKISPTRYEDFGIDLKDNEVEESPIKSSTTSNLSNFAQVLRDRYLMKPTSDQIKPFCSSISKKSRQPLSDVNSNTLTSKAQAPAMSKQREPIKEPFNKSNQPPKPLNTGDKSHIVAAVDVTAPIKDKPIFDLTKYAFQG